MSARRRPILLVLLATSVLAVVALALVAADWWFTLPEDETADYVGRQKCAECHQKEVDAWTGSDHDRAMDLATPQTVLGNFDDQEYTQFALEEIVQLGDGDLRAVVRAALPAHWALVLRQADKAFAEKIFACMTEDVRARVKASMKGPVPVRPCDVITARQEIGDVVRRLKAEGRIRVPFGVTSKMFRRGEEFFVTTEGPTGKMETYQVKYTFGVRPLQQYLVEFPDGAKLKNGAELPKGSVQCLRLTWDTLRKRWFNQYPGESIPAGDQLHWTGPRQTWNYMCAECHSTNLRKGYDLATNTYHTTFSEIDVSCETCHGPGSLHVKLAESPSLFWDRRYRYGLPDLKDADPRVQIENCAPCHVRRRIVYPNHPGGEKFHARSPKLLDHYIPELFDNASPYLANRAVYYADGQVLEEDYVYGSFIQSKMYAKQVRCTDCHDPHSVRVKTEDPTDNRLCTGCHANAHPSGQYDTVTHHHHPDASKPGTRCVECHMPETLYMVVDPRRDHSLRSPRPDLTVSLGIPNACNGCHNDPAKGQTPEWAAEQVRQWYGKRKDEPHFAHAIAAGRAREPGGQRALLDLLRRKDTSAMVRSSALRLLADYQSEDALGAAISGLDDPDPLVRVTAIGCLDRLAPDEMMERLGPLLSDPLRAIRTEAARVLSRVPVEALSRKDREAFYPALAEYVLGQESMADQAPVHLSMALVYDNQGRPDKAAEEYRLAIGLDPESVSARVNLGSFYFDQAAAAEARKDRLATEAHEAQAAGRRLAALREAAAATRQFEAAKQSLARAEKEHQYAMKRMALAEEQYLAAIRISPRFVDVRDSLARLYSLQGRTRDAEAQLRKIIEMAPDQADAHYSLGLVLAEDETRLQEAALALAAAARLAPANARVRYNCGLALRKLGRLGDAENELKAAQRLAPAEPDYVYALAELYVKQERWAEAAECARRLVDLRPNVPQFRALLQQTEARAAQPKPPLTPRARSTP